MKSRLDSIDILSYVTLSMTDEVLELENTQLLLLADWSTFFFHPSHPSNVGTKTNPVNCDGND